MGDPGAGSSAGGPPPAGAVVVPIDDIEAGAAAPEAPPAAAPAAAAAGAPRRQTRVRGRVTCAASAAARARRPAWTGLNARLAWAAALFLLGCAAAGLAFFAMLLPAADSSAAALQVKVKACAPAPATDLRAASEYLLLAASAQVLAATMGLLVPASPLLASLGWLVGWLTAHRATYVLWMLVACHGSSTAHGGALAFHFCLFFAMLCAAFLVGCGAVSRR